MIPQLVAMDLKRDEGWREFLYDDATGEPIVKGSRVIGYPTIGFGFCVSRDRGTPMPDHIARMWLEWEIEQRWLKLVAAEPWLNDQPEDVQRALTNMAYQLGVNGVLRFKKMLAALRDGNRDKAVAEALDSTWAKQTPARAKRIAKLIRGR